MAENTKTSIEDSLLESYTYSLTYTLYDMQYIYKMKNKNNNIVSFHICEN